MRPTLPILLVLTILSACNNSSDGTGEDVSEPDAHSESHSHENVSGVREGIWPPEPLGMENEQPLPVQLRPRARQSVVNVARRSVMNNPEVLAAIGENYGTYDASLSPSKSDDVASFVFYNYDTDQSVEAVLGSDGNISVVTQMARDWQPAENAQEVEQAITLVREWLESDGYTLDTLQGTAMLTYPSRASEGEEAPPFYDTRVLYVTFGNGDGEPPLYSARVDIGTNIIREGGPL